MHNSKLITLLCIVLTFCSLDAWTQSVTASDCADAVDVCTDLNFIINPNGYGLIDEIPAPGSLGNPLYNPGVNNMPGSWGNSNEGCLKSLETNSTWMIINISGTGDLEFIFGGNGTQYFELAR